MLAISGFTMIVVFMALIMMKRVSALVGLILVPLLAAILLGKGLGAGGMMLDGIKEVAPTAVLLVFAIFYFGIMIDAGLFQPLVTRIVRWVGNDPLRATLGLTALVAIISLDGDGTTTLLVTVVALLPVFRRLGINSLIFLTLGGLCGSILNMTPWGGPAARVAAVLKVSPNALFVPLLPAMAAGLAATFALAWYFGVRERRRLAGRDVETSETVTVPDDNSLVAAFESDPAALRPRLIWVNVAMTVVLMLAVILHLAPLPALFMTGTALALMINYPKLSDQRARLVNHAGNVLNTAILVLAAGAFTGVLTGTGMLDAMAGSIVSGLPQALGPHLGFVTAVLASPLTFFMSNDAFYFGVLPVIAKSGQTYGISPEAIGRASLLGLQIHGLSPLVAAVYLKCALVDVELGDLQRFALKYYLLITAIIIAVALLTGAVPA
ncbi:citrate:proton symporter [Sphingomonas oligophenolica]|uniref:Citrate:proton symporter n=1 Tax=Sphingomonas oligophenolica TaxID=301154 RepID=A0ABU9Y659_9SPHN